MNSIQNRKGRVGKPPDRRTSQPVSFYKKDFYSTEQVQPVPTFAGITLLSSIVITPIWGFNSHEQYADNGGGGK